MKILYSICSLWLCTASFLTADVCLSYNIRYDAGGDRGERDWKQRRGKVTDFILSQKPSVIGLQEVLYKQLLDVEKKLTEYGRVGVGRDDAKKRGEFSPIFYRKSDWKLDSNGTFWLSDTPKKPGSKSWGNGIPRICTWARLLDPKGQGVYIFNTHWDHRSQASREKAAALLLSRIKTRKHSNEPYILMGDFNATPDNPAIKKLLTSKLLIDHGKLAHRTFNGWKKGLIAGKPIDHIFCSPHFENVQVEARDNAAASDHHPVVMRWTDINRLGKAPLPDSG